MDNTTNMTSQMTSAEDDRIKELTFWLDGVATNVIVVLGLLGNALSALVLSRKEMRSASGSGVSGANTNTYLRALAAWDSVVLVSSLLLIGLPALPSMTYYRSHVYAYVHSYFYPLALIAQTATIWLTVAFTLERYVAVCLPLKCSSRSSACRARYVIALVSTASLVYNLPRWFDFRPVHATAPETNTTYLTVNYCQGVLYTEIYFSWLYALVMCVIPLAILSVFNTCLVVAVQRSTKQRMRMHVTSSARENNVTVMLVTVVVVFMVCQIPALVYNVAFAVNNAHVTSDFRYRVLSHVRNFLVSVNSAVNFLLYCAIGRRFRRTLLRMLRYRRNNHNNSSNRKYYLQQQQQQQRYKQLQQQQQERLLLQLNTINETQLSSKQLDIHSAPAAPGADRFHSFTATDRFNRRLHLLVSMRAQYLDKVVTSSDDLAQKSSSQESRGSSEQGVDDTTKFCGSESRAMRPEGRNDFHKRN